MKNLKRALSLVLSTAMVLGMMVVGTGAAFADVKAAHNEEAIGLIQAAGIMTGDENGKFNPDNNITRNEMAVVMVNLLDLDTKDYAGASNFADVPAWAVPYVDACYANGIVSGVSATEFGGANNVTTAQAALMMLKALGYFEVQPLNDWMLDTIKTASKIDLLDGINAKATDAMTRNEVAQLVMNTLFSNYVEENSNGANTTIKGEGFEITTTTGIDRETLKTTMMDELFGDRFEKKETTTALGLPAIKWVDNKEKKDVVVIADEADEVIIATKKTTTKALYIDKVDEDYEGDMNDDAVASGDVVYYYDDAAYVVSYELAKISEIKDASNYQKKNNEGREVKITLDVYGMDDKVTVKNFYNDEFAGFDYEEDDYVLVVIEDGEVVASELAEIVEGTVKAKNSAGKVNIGGTYYTIANKNITLGVKDDATVVLNKAGQIIAIAVIEEAETEAEYAYIYNVTTKTVEGEDAENEDGFVLEGEDATTTYAYVVLADGSKAKYAVCEDCVATKGDVVAYTINKDGEIEIEEVLEAEQVVLSKDDKKFNGVYADSKTEFVFASIKSEKGKADKLVVETITGVKNVDINDKAVVIADKTIELVFVLAPVAEAEVESDTMYAVMVDDNYVETVETIDDEDVSVFTYKVFANGEEIEMAFEETVEIAEGEIFAYEMGENFAEIVASKLEDGKIAYVGENFYEINDEEYTVADDAEIYTVTANYDEIAEGEFELKGFDYADGGKLAKKANIKFIADKDNEISLIFVLAENK